MLGTVVALPLPPYHIWNRTRMVFGLICLAYRGRLRRPVRVEFSPLLTQEQQPKGVAFGRRYLVCRG